MRAKEKIPAFAYLRVSSKGQLDGHGFERQSGAIRSHARGRYEIRDTFKDAYTGTEADRPAFNEACERILKNGVRTILIEDMSRLARDSMVQQVLLAKLADMGITLIDCSTGEDVTAAAAGNPMLKAMVQIRGVFAELEKASLVAKLKRARTAKRKRTGKCEGAHAFGTQDTGERETLRYMRRLRRLKRGKRMSYARIAERLNAEGFKTRHGGAWHATTVRNILTRPAPSKRARVAA